MMVEQVLETNVWFLTFSMHASMKRALMVTGAAMMSAAKFFSTSSNIPSGSRHAARS